MVEYQPKDHYTADDLVEIIRILRQPETGCPWDRVQTHSSIRMNFLEEAYEAVDALDCDDAELMCEELGDVLMQVVFHTCIEAERERFDWQDVCDGVCRKLIFRHPHIFGAEPGNEGINDWDALKNKEKGRTTLAQDLESVPEAMPALMRAAKLQKRAQRRLGDQPVNDRNLSEALADAVDAAPDMAEDAVGKLLFEVVRLARAAGVDPEQALQKQNARFVAGMKTIPQPETPDTGA